VFGGKKKKPQDLAQELPAKRLAAEPQVLTVDWAAAQSESGSAMLA
jgi:hypothetical protein